MASACSKPAVATQGVREAARLPAEAPPATLREVARRYGTPTYAYDLERLRLQLAKLREHIPAAVEILYSLKANPALGLCGFFADCGLGVDVASAGELATALKAGVAAKRILLSGPDKSPAVLDQLRSVPEAIVSVDSVSELQLLAQEHLPHRVLLRLRPDFRCLAVCTAGPDARFGIPFDDLPHCRKYLRNTRVVGFHVFAGSQILDAATVIHHLRSAVDECLRAAEVLGIAPEIIDMGGGFGVPYGPEEPELDLNLIGQELQSLVERAAPARLVMELGRFLVAESGWYLTRVLANQVVAGRPAVVVDGGTHQRGDSCGIGLRHKAFPFALESSQTNSLVPTAVLGCLSHPGDVLVEAAPLPSLQPGDLLAFPNAGAYGLAASPVLFHGHTPPAEAVFDGATIELLRVRQPVSAVLEGQSRCKG
jgi:diaminopimelate decarboxylase